MWLRKMINRFVNVFTMELRAALDTHGPSLLAQLMQAYPHSFISGNKTSIIAI
jgi:hypothetical protein